MTAAILVLLLASCGGERAEAPAATAAAAPAAPLQFTSVSEVDGEITILYAENGEPRELFGEGRDTGKRKYTFGDGKVLYEVKPGQGQDFKLRTPDGKLRWKVKVGADGIRISDNEENANPHEVKTGDGVLRLDAIPPLERYILVAELRSRKR